MAWVEPSVRLIVPIFPVTPGPADMFPGTGGSTQATYDGRPLYTYVGDKSPGQDGGNNINLNGGLWKVVPVTGG